MAIFEPLIKEFSKKQKEFCSNLLRINAEEFDTLKEDKLDELYDMLCDIESGIDIGENAKLTDEEETATELVTIMGDAIAKDLGEDVTQEEFSKLINE